MIKGEEAETPEILKALDDLADRQQRVFKATGDLSTAIKNSRKGGE